MDFFLSFLGSRTVRTESRTKVNDGSKDVPPVQEVTFWSPIDDLTPQSGRVETQFDPKGYLQLITTIVNNSSYIRPKITTGH